MVREVSGNLMPIEGNKAPYKPKIPSLINDLDGRVAKTTDAFINHASLDGLTGGRDRRPQGNPVLTRK